jgi:hypothetical protein
MMGMEANERVAAEVVQVRFADWGRALNAYVFCRTPGAPEAMVAGRQRDATLYAALEQLERAIETEIAQEAALPPRAAGDPLKGFAMVEARVILQPGIRWPDLVQMRRARSVYLGRRVGTEYVTALRLEPPADGPRLGVAPLAREVRLTGELAQIDLGGPVKTYRRVSTVGQCVAQIGEVLRGLGLDPANLVLPANSKALAAIREEPAPRPMDSVGPKARPAQEFTREEQGNREAASLAAGGAPPADESWGGEEHRGDQTDPVPASGAAPAVRTAAKVKPPSAVGPADAEPAPARRAGDGATDAVPALVRPPATEANAAELPAPETPAAAPPAPAKATGGTVTAAAGGAQLPAVAETAQPPGVCRHYRYDADLAPLLVLSQFPLVLLNGLPRLVSDSAYYALGAVSLLTVDGPRRGRRRPLRVRARDFESDGREVRIHEIFLGKQVIDLRSSLNDSVRRAGVPEVQRSDPRGPERLEEAARNLTPARPGAATPEAAGGPHPATRAEGSASAEGVVTLPDGRRTRKVSLGR